MTRTLCLESVLVVFTLAAIGCGSAEVPRNDMPIKGSEGADKKGKATKTMEATLYDPPKK